MNRRTILTVLGLIVFAAALYVSIRVTRDMTDFKVYFTAAQRVVRAEPLYREADGFFVFKYLPAFALIVSPLAAVDLPVARAVWFALSFALLVLFVRGSVREWSVRRLGESRLLLLVVVVMAKDYIRELSLGQTNVLFGVLVLAAIAAVRRNRGAVAGTAIAASILVKPYGVIFIPWLAWTAGIGAAFTSAAIVIGALIAPMLLYGWSGNVDLLVAWYRTVTGTTVPTLLIPENIGFASMWAKWIGVGALASMLALVSAAITFTIVVANAIWRKREAPAWAAYVDASALLLLVPLISPQGWDYVLLLATPALVCLLDGWSRFSTWSKAVVAIALIFVALPSRDLLGLALHRRLMATAVISVAALALWAVVMTIARRDSTLAPT